MIRIVKTSRLTELEEKEKQLQTIEQDYQVYLQNKDKYIDYEYKSGLYGEALMIIRELCEKEGFEANFADECVAMMAREVRQLRQTVSNIQTLISPQPKKDKKLETVSPEKP